LKKRKYTGIKAVFAALFIICCTALYSLSETDNNAKETRAEEIVAAFITVSDHGNNLYIDNFTLGKRPGMDIAVTSINNIPQDTSFASSSSAFKIRPVINIANLGYLSTTDTVFVSINIAETGYNDTAVIFGMGSAQVLEVSSFDSITITPGTPFHVYAAVNNLSADSNLSNNAIYQYSVFLSGAPRNVLFEEFTGATSSGSAQQNVFLNNFINARFDSIVAIKYHRGVPPPARDSIYLANPGQSDSMAAYYSNSQIPNTVVDGILPVNLPYSTPGNLNTPFYTRAGTGSPISLSVTDTRIAGDSIQADVQLNILYNLPAADYRLKVNAVERRVMFSPKPAGWFDSVFYDAFRKAYPGIGGTPIPTIAGTYNFRFTYLRESNWVDSMMYTAVFVQNQSTKEVLNSAKARNTLARDILPEPENLTVNIKNIFDKDLRSFNSSGSSVFGHLESPLLLPWNYVELFEGRFLPSGWSVKNPDGYLTYTQVQGANGTVFSGSRSVKMPFYIYPVPDSLNPPRDTMLTKVYTGAQYTDTLKFDYAYAPYGPGYNDSLIVKLSLDGGATFTHTIFSRGGLSLATSPSTTTSFLPNQPSQWRTFAFPLNGVVGIQQISQEVPGSYILNQNYPNPFNPVTKIQFSIPKQGFVKLRVFDIAGREIRQVVNSELAAGSYTVDFNGISLASGVYFYRLEAEEFTQTKKMVIVK
jgi:hypothetical protein